MDIRLTWNNGPNLGLSAASFPCHTERGHLWKSWGVRAWIMKAPLKITKAGGQGETSETLETKNHGIHQVPSTEWLRAKSQNDSPP